MLRKTSWLLAVAVISGSVQVNFGGKSLTLGLGESRVFADEGGPREGPKDTGGPSPEAENGGRREAPEGDAPRAGNPKTKIEKMFRAYDKSGDGKVSGAEWLSMFEGASKPGDRQDRVKAWGRRADRNKDGSISFEEFKWWVEVGKRQPEGDKPGPKDGEGGKREGAGDEARTD